LRLTSYVASRAEAKEGIASLERGERVIGIRSVATRPPPMKLPVSGGAGKLPGVS
jgi:hypothetical protein